VAEPHGRVLEGWLVTLDGPIQLRPVPTIRLSALETMLSFVRAEFDEGLAQKILNLHERGDVPGVWGVEIGQLPEGCFEEVFGAGGLIEQINRFVPSDAGDGEADEFPPWSSGDLATDLLADLSYSLGDFGQAWQAINCMNLQGLSNYLRRFGDLRKGPEEREKEGLKAWFWKHKGEFEDDFYGD